MKKIVRMLLISIFAMIFLSTTVFAHALLTVEIEPGLIQFIFDDGDAMENAFISVYDESGTEIATGATDSLGRFDYSNYVNARSISAQDLFGHQIYHVLENLIQAEEQEPEDVNEHGSDEEESEVPSANEAPAAAQPITNASAPPANTPDESSNTILIIVVVAAIIAVAVVFHIINQKKKHNNRCFISFNSCCSGILCILVWFW